MIDSFVSVLNITDEEYKGIMKNPTEYSFMPVNDSKKRLHILYDLFKTIYSDYEIDELERKAIIQYAIGLGYPIKKAEEVIEKSIDIFNGNINFFNYQYLINAQYI